MKLMKVTLGITAVNNSKNFNYNFIKHSGRFWAFFVIFGAISNLYKRLTETPPGDLNSVWWFLPPTRCDSPRSPGHCKYTTTGGLSSEKRTLIFPMFQWTSKTLLKSKKKRLTVSGGSIQLIAGHANAGWECVGGGVSAEGDAYARGNAFYAERRNEADDRKRSDVVSVVKPCGFILLLNCL